MSSLLSDDFEKDLDIAICSKIAGMVFDPIRHTIITKCADGHYHEFGVEEIINYENN